MSNAFLSASNDSRPILIVSKCSWTLWNFRLPLAKFLRDQGHVVHLAAGSLPPFDEKLKEQGFRFHPVPLSFYGANPFRELISCVALFILFLRLRPKVVHLFTVKPVIYGGIVARLIKIPQVVCTITGLGYTFSDSSGWVGALTRRLYRFALKKVLVCFQNSDDRKLFLDLKLVEEKRSFLVPGSGVNTEEFRPQTKTQEAPQVTFLMISRLLKDKGVAEFFSAAERMRKENRNARFWIVGGLVPDRPNAIPRSEVSRLEEKQIIKWFGSVEDVRPYLAEADVVVLPSYREGIPRSLLEAAAMEKALITTNVPGCREVVDDGSNGYLVAVKNIEQLCDRMLKLIENPTLMVAMGKAGRLKICRDFDEREVFRRTHSAYFPASDSEEIALPKAVGSL